MIELRVPGFVYYECLDPDTTEVPRESGWPKATRHKVGRGYQFRYGLTPAEAVDIIRHVTDFGEAISYGVDDPSVGQRITRWVAEVKMREEPS